MYKFNSLWGDKNKKEVYNTININLDNLKY